MSKLKLVPGDDAALIAASNLGAAWYLKDPTNDLCVQDGCDCWDAVIDELRRRQDEHEKRGVRAPLACVICGTTFTPGEMIYTKATGEARLICTDCIAKRKRTPAP